MNIKPLFGVILTLIMSSTSFAAPQEKTTDTITRNSGLGNTVRTELSLNEYRQEAYQDSYTVEVPYEAQETYYVDIPYESEETYYENIPYTERVPYTDYEDYYEREHVCRNVTRHRQECRNENVCEPGHRVCQPITECGTNARGERICKTRNECRQGERQCRETPRCHQVPYTERQCDWESIRKTRPVIRYRDETRYRQELRTRRVTKYRQEARTRSVTRYRTENRCCITKYRPVFDHQFTQPVSVIFPQEALLLAGEQESVHFQLRGNEQSPEVSVRIQSNIFDYVIAETRQEGREKIYILKTQAKWHEKNAGTESVKGLKLQFRQDQAVISFQETVASPRLTSVYTLEVRDQQSQAIAFTHRFQANEGRAFDIAASGLLRAAKYDILLHVERHGSNVASGALSFDQKTSYEKKELDEQEVANLRQSSQVELLRIEGSGAERVVIFQDKTPSLEEVRSQYKLVVWKKHSSGKIDWLGEKNFSREEITRAGAELGIALKSLQLNPATGTRLYMDLVVRRESAQYLGNQKVQFIVNKTF